jgi:hypothetical protein
MVEVISGKRIVWASPVASSSTYMYPQTTEIEPAQWVVRQWPDASWLSIAALYA